MGATLLVPTGGCFKFGFTPPADAAPADWPSLEPPADQAADRLPSDDQNRDLPPTDLVLADGPQPDLPVTPPGIWVPLSAGSFVMGSPASEACRDPGDEIYHPVELTHDFEITATETTQNQFFAQMSYNPAVNNGCGGDCPVETVTWHEAAAYCNSLSQLTQRPTCYSCTGTKKATNCAVDAAYQAGQTIYDCPGYRLPTEAEWEYAIRATTSTSLYAGTLTACKQADSLAELIGWYKVNAGGQTHAVGLKQPNDWGLLDMAGNVREWTNDWYQADLGSGQVQDPVGPASGTGRVTRGGHYFDFAETLRSAHRDEAFPENAFDNLGFRCARSL